jgi:hypothetical protein
VSGVGSLEEFHKAIASFAITDIGLEMEPAALAAARRSLDESGLLLLGEVHGVRENPLLIWALMLALDVSSLALEWFAGLRPTIMDFLAEEVLPDNDDLWWGDGRITAGHLAVLAERSAAEPLNLVLLDGVTGADWSWYRRDQAMASRILAASAPDSRTLVVAGNAHTPTTETDLGVPMGAHLGMQRPGVLDILINYCRGSFYNLEPRQFRAVDSPHEHVGLHEDTGQLILVLPAANEAVVPHRSRIARRGMNGLPRRISLQPGRCRAP